MSKICNYCGAEMQDSEVLCKKCGFPNTGESREFLEKKLEAGIYKEFLVDREDKAGLKILSDLSAKKKLPPEVRKAGSGLYVVISPCDAVPLGKEAEFLRLEMTHKISQLEYQLAGIKNDVHTIKRCTVFFTALMIINLVCSFLIALGAIK